MFINKFSGYLVSQDNIDLESKILSDGGMLQHFHTNTKTVDDDKIIITPNCDLACCEKYFNSPDTICESGRTVRPNQVYKHFKTGKPVRVITVAQDTENLNSYHVIYECPDGSIWSRPLTMFLSKVDKEKYPDAKQEYRFEFVSQILFY